MIQPNSQPWGEAPRYCRNCVWFLESPRGVQDAGAALCMHKQAQRGTFYLVYGGPPTARDAITCQAMRAGFECGREAKLWQEKPNATGK